jgi:hypothetical protein
MLPVGLILSDPEAWKDPKLIVGAPIMGWLIAYTITGAGTAFADWLRRRTRNVGQAEGKGLSPRSAGGGPSEFPQRSLRGRVGEDPG